MKPITLQQLNEIDTEKHEQVFNQEKLDIDVQKCINDINLILSRLWHKPKPFHLETGIFWGYEAFNIVKDLFEKEGIIISYYQPHARLTVNINEVRRK